LSAKFAALLAKVANFDLKFRPNCGRPVDLRGKSTGDALATICKGVVGFAIATAVSLGLLAPSVNALPPDRVYEMVSPPDKNDGDVGAGLFGNQTFAGAEGDRVIYMSLGGWNAPTNSVTGIYLAERGEEFWTSTSALLPVAPFSTLGGAVVSSMSADASRVIVGTNRHLNGEPAQNGEQGIFYLYDPLSGEAQLILPDLDIEGNPTENAFAEWVGNSDYSRVFMQANAALTEDAVGLPTSSGGPIYLFEDGEHTLQSVLPNGDAYRAELPTASRNGLTPNVTSEDGDVLYFQIWFGPSDPDPRGLYRRDFSGATPQTVRINDPETQEDPGGTPNAEFAGASSDGTIAYFTSNQKLVDEDEDNLTDVYRYDHSKPAGQRLTLISKDNNPDDPDAGINRVHNVSADGSTVVFSSNSQLVPGEPTGPGSKLYVARNGQVQFIGITGEGFSGEVNAENVALAQDGSLMALVTAAQLTAHDNGGFEQVYLRDNTAGEIECVSCLDGTANTAPAQFRASSALSMFGSAAMRAVRNLSNEGHVFFETTESLLPQDTNGKLDVYVWQDGELDLISTGRSTDHSFLAHATPDGKDVFFVTREKLSGWDWDDHLDLYTARVGGGLPEPPEPVEPCTGDDCQGPPPLPPAFPKPTSEDAEGPGNAQPGPVNCTPAERKADKAAQKAKRLEKKAKRLAKKARKASGKKAKRLRKQAKQVKRQAKSARQQASKARTQLELCREEAQL